MSESLGLLNWVVRRTAGRRFALLGGVALAVGATIAGLARPWPLKWIVDDVLGGLSGGVARPEYLWPAIALFVVAQILAELLRFLADRATVVVGHALVTELRTETFHALQNSTPRRGPALQTGDLVCRLAADTLALQTVATTAFVPMVTAVATLLGLSVVAMALNPELTTVAFLALPLLIIPLKLFGPAISKHAGASRLAEGRLYTTAEGEASGLRAVRALGAELPARGRWQQASRTALLAAQRLYTVQGAYGVVVSATLALGTGAVLLAGAHAVLARAMTLGDLVVFLGYLSLLYAPLQTLSHTRGLLREAWAGLERVREILDQPPTLRDGSVDVLGQPAVLEARGVSFAYAAGHPILEAVNLRARRGELVVLAGPSGCGKTTLLELLGRLRDPDLGRVELDGQDMRSLRLASLGRVVALGTQPPLVLPLSIRENLTFGRVFTDAELWQRLESVALAERIRELPERLDSVLSGAGDGLSVGERVRLTLARALLGDPAVLLLDEPTLGLDPENAERVVRLLREIARERICIVASHARLFRAHADVLLDLRGRNNELQEEPVPLERAAAGR